MGPLDEFPKSMGKVAPRSLKLHGISSPLEATRFTEKELLAIHGVGPKAIQILKDELAKHGRRLRR